MKKSVLFFSTVVAFAGILVTGCKDKNNPVPVEPPAKLGDRYYFEYDSAKYQGIIKGRIDTVDKTLNIESATFNQEFDMTIQLKGAKPDTGTYKDVPIHFNTGVGEAGETKGTVTVVITGTTDSTVKGTFSGVGAPVREGTSEKKIEKGDFSVRLEK